MRFAGCPVELPCYGVDDRAGRRTRGEAERQRPVVAGSGGDERKGLPLGNCLIGNRIKLRQVIQADEELLAAHVTGIVGCFDHDLMGHTLRDIGHPLDDSALLVDGHADGILGKCITHKAVGLLVGVGVVSVEHPREALGAR